jgi:hypothetical protein
VIPALPRAAATQVLILRFAMLSGLLLFGAATWFTARQGRVASLEPERATLFAYIFAALAAGALAGMIAIRSRLANQIANSGTPKQAVSLYLIGYAMAEGAGLFGGVVWFLGGSPQLYIAGLLLLAAGFQVLPVRAEDAGSARR